MNLILDSRYHGNPRFDGDVGTLNFVRAPAVEDGNDGSTCGCFDQEAYKLCGPDVDRSII